MSCQLSVVSCQNDEGLWQPATSNQQLEITTMEYNRRDPDDRFEQISRSLMRWVLGPGLLSVHVGAYLITLVSLLLWNFARTPDDIWVDDPLRRWGLVVVFHATAVGAGLAAWRLMRLGESSAPQQTRPQAPRRSLAPAAVVTHAESNGAAPRSAAATATAEEWARRWLRESVRVVRDAVGPSTVSNGHEANGHAQRASASAVAGPEITEWGVLFARRAREMMSSARDHLSPQSRPANGSPAAETSTDLASTWPAGTEAARPAPPNGTWPAPTNGAIHASEPTALPEQSNGSVPHFPVETTPVITDTMVNAATASGDDVPLTSTVSEDARWTWVEAAAAAWLARREMDDPPADPVEAPPPPADGPTASP
jgi:hypothetical protein